MEGLGPNTCRSAVLRKVREHRTAGVDAVCVVDPLRVTVFVFTTATDAVPPVPLTEGDTLTSAVLPGWSARVGDLLVIREVQ